MDTLSVSVAIVGLLSSADTVSNKVNALLETNGDARSLAEAVLLETSSIEASLPRLRRVITDDRNPFARGHVFLDQVTTLLTGYVKRFSDLERLLGAAAIAPIDGPTWTRNKQRIEGTVECIQPYRVSLFVMLQILELQSVKDQDRSLERLQSELEDLQDQILSIDPDLARRISKVEILPGFTTAPTASLDLRQTASAQSDAIVAPRSGSSMSPTRGLHSADLERRRPAWISSWRNRTSRSDESVQRVSRTTSVRTTSSATSAASESTASTSSSSSRISLATVSNVSVYALPITAEDLSNGHHYLEHHTTSIVEESDENMGGDETALAESSFQHRKVLPILTRPGTDPRPQSANDFRAPRTSKPMPTPLAEIEMSARKYQGYWRPSFTANLPAATAMCGALLLTSGNSAGPPTMLAGSPENTERAAVLCETLEAAPSPAKVIMTLHSHKFETVLFALKVSLDASQVPAVPTKIAFAIYQKLAEAKEDGKKLPKLWQAVAKLLKKVPQETMVPLMFLLAIGRRLRARGLMVDGRAAAGYLTESLWPQPGSNDRVALDTEAGDAAVKLLLDHYDEIPDELPVMLQAVNYRFESGSRCNLLALFSSKKA